MKTSVTNNKRNNILKTNICYNVLKRAVGVEGQLFEINAICKSNKLRVIFYQ